MNVGRILECHSKLKLMEDFSKFFMHFNYMFDKYTNFVYCTTSLVIVGHFLKNADPKINEFTVLL